MVTDELISKVIAFYLELVVSSGFQLERQQLRAYRSIDEQPMIVPEYVVEVRGVPTMGRSILEEINKNIIDPVKKEFSIRFRVEFPED